MNPHIPPFSNSWAAVNESYSTSHSFKALVEKVNASLSEDNENLEDGKKERKDECISLEYES